MFSFYICTSLWSIRLINLKTDKQGIIFITHNKELYHAPLLFTIIIQTTLHIIFDINSLEIFYDIFKNTLHKSEHVFYNSCEVVRNEFKY
ncbi:hypothetical protein DWB87_01740 [Staphylococcus aureus]|nr:hypothetical protein DWB87_01740 [Staphylococcus aureus]